MSTRSDLSALNHGRKESMSRNAVDIVVADDNAILLSVLSEIFKECGYLVRTASDGLGALGEIRNYAPDILVSDLHMPRMSGFELLSIVRRRYPRIKVIAMSTSYSGEIVPQGVAADAFYEKGAASVARLLQMVNAMKDEPQLQSSRATTPIWIPRPSLDPDGGSGASFACPECLRAYRYSINENASGHHMNCPYCLYRVHLAIVPANMETDKPPLVRVKS
jgi:CheY-like chemotaxis protein